MEHKWLKLFVDGVWTGNPDRTIRLNNGEVVDLDEYAKSKGIELPDAKQKHKKEVNSYADMGQPLDEGHPEIDGDGDSQGEE